MAEESKPPPTTQELSVDVEKLKKDMAKEQGWFKRVGTILAFVAALFAVPKGALELLEKVRARPDTKITQEPYLVLDYDPKTKNLSFGFDFTVSNTGSRLDTIKNVSGNLQRIDYTAPPLLTLEDTSFHFSENNAPITNRFPINKDSTRSLHSQIDLYLSDDTRISFFEPKSRWRLQVEFTGEFDKKYVATYCLDVSKTIADDIANAKDKLSKRLLNPWCD